MKHRFESLLLPKKNKKTFLKDKIGNVFALKKAAKEVFQESLAFSENTSSILYFENAIFYVFLGKGFVFFYVSNGAS